MSQEDTLLISDVLNRRSNSLFHKHKKPWHQVRAEEGDAAGTRQYYLPTPDSEWRRPQLPPYKGEDRDNLTFRFFNRQTEHYMNMYALKLRYSPTPVLSPMSQEAISKLQVLTLGTMDASVFTKWMCTINCRTLVHPLRFPLCPLTRDTIEYLGTVNPDRLYVQNSPDDVLARHQEVPACNDVTETLIQKADGLPLCRYGEQLVALDVPVFDPDIDIQSMEIIMRINSSVAVSAKTGELAPSKGDLPPAAPTRPTTSAPTIMSSRRNSTADSSEVDQSTPATIPRPPSAGPGPGMTTPRTIPKIEKASPPKTMNWHQAWINCFDQLAESIEQSLNATIATVLAHYQKSEDDPSKSRDVAQIEQNVRIAFIEGFSPADIVQKICGEDITEASTEEEKQLHSASELMTEAEARLRSISQLFMKYCEQSVRTWVDDTAVAHRSRARYNAVKASDEIQESNYMPGSDIWNDAPGTTDSNQSVHIPTVTEWADNGIILSIAQDSRYQREVEGGIVDGVTQEEKQLDPPPTTASHDSIDAAEADEVLMKVVAREISGSAAIVAAILSEPRLSMASPKDRAYVPLQCMIDYKGFRVMCRAEIPGLREFTESTLAHGLRVDPIEDRENALLTDDKGRGYISSDQYFVSGPETLRTYLQQIAASLNLSPHVLRFGNTEVDIILSRGVEVHCSPNDGRYYIIGAESLFPAELPVSDLTLLTRRIRPEMLLLSSESLSADVFTSGSCKQSTLTAARCVASFCSEILPKSVRSYVDSDAILLQLCSAYPGFFSETLHSLGIPMHSLGLVATTSNVPAVRHLAKLEAVSRAASDLLLDAIRMVIRHGGSDNLLVELEEECREKEMEDFRNSRRGITTTPQDTQGTRKKDTRSRRVAAVREINEYVTNAIQQFITLFINDTQEGDEWWNEVLLPLVSQKYGVFTPQQGNGSADPENVQILRSDFSRESLIRALAHHSGFALDIAYGWHWTTDCPGCQYDGMESLNPVPHIVSVARPQARGLLDTSTLLSCSGSNSNADIAIIAISPMFTLTCLSDVLTVPTDAEQKRLAEVIARLNRRVYLEILARGTECVLDPYGPVPIVMLSLALAWTYRWPVSGADALFYAQCFASIARRALGISFSRTPEELRLSRNDPAAAFFFRVVIRICLVAWLTNTGKDTVQKLAAEFECTESENDDLTATIRRRLPRNAIYSQQDPELAILLINVARYARQRLEFALQSEHMALASLMKVQAEIDYIGLLYSTSCYQEAVSSAEAAEKLIQYSFGASHPLRVNLLLIHQKALTSLNRIGDANALQALTSSIIEADKNQAAASRSLQTIYEQMQVFTEPIPEAEQDVLDTETLTGSQVSEDLDQVSLLIRSIRQKSPVITEPQPERIDIIESLAATRSIIMGKDDTLRGDQSIGSALLEPPSDEHMSSQGPEALSPELNIADLATPSLRST